MMILLRGLARVMALMPERVVDAQGWFWGRLFGIFTISKRRIADQQLAWALPDRTARERLMIRRNLYGNLGRNAVEMLCWLGGGGARLQGRIDVVGLEHAERAFASGRGVIALTAHLGNWDLAALWMASRYPVTILSKTLGHKGLNAYWMSKRREAGIEVLPAHHSYRACLAALKRGGMLGFILDQNMIRKEGIFVNFFGRPACTTPGLALLSAHSGAPILPVFMIRLPHRRYEVRILPPVPPAPDRSEASLHALTQTCTTIIEEQIRQHPDQWIWMHRRWNTRPPGEAVAKRVEK